MVVWISSKTRLASEICVNVAYLEAKMCDTFKVECGNRGRLLCPLNKMSISIIFEVFFIFTTLRYSLGLG